MTTPLGFDALKGIVPRRIDPWPDHRTQGPNTRDSVQDAALGAWGVLFTPSPSCLESQRHRQQAKGHKNAWTLCGVKTIPWNNPRRNLLAPLMPSQLDGGCLEVFSGLEHHGWLANVRGCSPQRRVAMDGTQYFSSYAMHGPPCLRRHPTNSPTLSDHPAMPPVIVSPGCPEVIALPPACIMPQDGHDTQDCARVAGTRWMDTHAKPVAPDGVTWLGDDLSRNQPLCALALHHGGHVLCVCKPDSHATLSERFAFWQAHDAVKACATRRRGGRCTAVTMSR